MSSTFAWCESAKQVDAVLRQLGRPSVDVFVAVWPDAAWQLRKRGVDYVTPEAFYSESALLDNEEAILEEQQQWASIVDAFVCDRVASFAANAFEPARWSLYHLKTFFDEFRLRSYVLSEFFRCGAPGRVVAFAPPAQRTYRSHLGFYESLYALLFPAHARHAGVA